MARRDLRIGDGSVPRGGGASSYRLRSIRGARLLPSRPRKRGTAAPRPSPPPPGAGGEEHGRRGAGQAGRSLLRHRHPVRRGLRDLRSGRLRRPSQVRSRSGAAELGLALAGIGVGIVTAMRAGACCCRSKRPPAPWPGSWGPSLRKQAPRRARLRGGGEGCPPPVPGSTSRPRDHPALRAGARRAPPRPVGYPLFALGAGLLFGLLRDSSGARPPMLVHFVINAVEPRVARRDSCPPRGTRARGPPAMSEPSEARGAAASPTLAVLTLRVLFSLLGSSCPSSSGCPCSRSRRRWRARASAGAWGGPAVAPVEPPAVSGPGPRPPSSWPELRPPPRRSVVRRPRCSAPTWSCAATAAPPASRLVVLPPSRPDEERRRRGSSRSSARWRSGGGSAPRPTSARTGPDPPSRWTSPGS